MKSLAGASTTASEAVLVFACDMPHIDRATPLLLRGLLSHREADAVVAIDAEEHRQLLAAAYRPPAWRPRSRSRKASARRVRPPECSSAIG